tara:strand:+ start:1552 stop:1866 length:315 start_codon:yes stop_codon:yes gene_type:complete
MCITFFIHISVSYNFKPNILLIQSYLINFFLAFTSFMLLLSLNKKINIIITYLSTILIKVLGYFIFFYPIFYQDGVLYKKEFMIFFIPYFAGLISEIFSFKKLF